jgi:3-phenylpropionate/trans-cinnamate dioxygenase ferredoxin component
MERTLYLKLCAISDVPADGMRQFDLRGREFLVAGLEGRFYCLDGRCTHAGAPLSEGTLNGNILTCPWHYSRFDITTGAVIRGPSKDPLTPYKIKMENGQIFIDLPLDDE